jgi:hypothetical protein
MRMAIPQAFRSRGSIRSHLNPVAASYELVHGLGIENGHDPAKASGRSNCRYEEELNGPEWLAKMDEDGKEAKQREHVGQIDFVASLSKNQQWRENLWGFP